MFLEMTVIFVNRKCDTCTAKKVQAQHFPVFGLNTERYSLSCRIQSECGKTRTRITPNTDTFHAVQLAHFIPLWFFSITFKKV